MPTRDASNIIFIFGDLVLLSTKNISSTRPSKKLDYKKIGPFKVLKKIIQNNLN